MVKNKIVNCPLICHTWYYKLCFVSCKINRKGNGFTWYIFHHFFQQETTFVTSTCFPVHRASPEKWVSLKGINLLLRTKLFPCGVDPYYKGDKNILYGSLPWECIHYHINTLFEDLAIITLLHYGNKCLSLLFFNICVNICEVK